MTFDYELKLIDLKSGENSMGDPVHEKVNERTVLCAVESVGYREFYEAARHDMQPEIKFILNKYEYQKEEYAEYEGDLYRVLRTYENRKPSQNIDEFETLELICEGAKGYAITEVSN